MANGVSVRRRAAVVASAAVVAVLSAATMAGAHQGNSSTDVLHLCVKTSTGEMRVVSPSGPNCRRGERAVHVPLTTGDDAALEAFMQDLMDANHPSDLVHWNNVAGVPQGLVDAATGWLSDGGVSWSEIQSLPAALSDGQVDFAELQNVPTALADGQIDFAELQNVPTALADGEVAYGELTGTPPTDSVNSDTVDDGTLIGDDIDDGSLTGADLAQGAVTPDKVTPVIGSASDAVPSVIVGTGADVPFIPASVTAGDESRVAITGQVQLQLSSCGGACSATISYQLLRLGGSQPVPVSPVYQVQLSDPGHLLDVASISAMDVVPAGVAQHYQIRLVRVDGGPGTISYSAAVLNALLLGVTG
jgi:hypothetical protein